MFERRRRIRAVLVLLSCGAVQGCSRDTVNSLLGRDTTPAPLSGGETMTFHWEGEMGNARAVITFERDDDGFIIKSNSKGFPPQHVGFDLAPESGPVNAYDLGVVWIPPSQRKVGERSIAGLAKEMKFISGRNVIVVTERSYHSNVYHFDEKTGFVTFADRQRGKSTLLSSTIPGL